MKCVTHNKTAPTRGFEKSLRQYNINKTVENIRSIKFQHQPKKISEGTIINCYVKIKTGTKMFKVFAVCVYHPLCSKYILKKHWREGCKIECMTRKLDKVNKGELEINES